MRLTSEFWVAALTRRVFAGGGFAAVVRRGAREAGSIFITVRDHAGGLALYGPAAQASYLEARPSDRQFARLAAADEAAIAERLEKEARFDPDFWMVEIELAGTEAAQDYFDIAAA